MRAEGGERVAFRLRPTHGVEVATGLAYVDAARGSGVDSTLTRSQAKRTPSPPSAAMTPAYRVLLVLTVSTLGGAVNVSARAFFQNTWYTGLAGTSSSSSPGLSQ